LWAGKGLSSLNSLVLIPGVSRDSPEVLRCC
jgi:hypothetical protein